MTFDDNKLDSKKYINNLLETSSSNESDDFNKFIASSFSERLILRYRDLVQFVIAGKTDKLKELQNIIGFQKYRRLEIYSEETEQ